MQKNNKDTNSIESMEVQNENEKFGIPTKVLTDTSDDENLETRAAKRRVARNHRNNPNKDTKIQNKNEKASIEEATQTTQKIKERSNSPPIVLDGKDYDNFLHKVKQDELPFHAYTAKCKKSHAFMIRGLGEGTKIPDLEEDILETHEIKLRAAYQMTTKNSVSSIK
ncbi:unnamed protein product [Psylliodes chrysocephalus]|uniref:Uncharacterized protein n=1 Tax=Psylliodes chrysocephalus TaxID=3402493 RepID=A0A9P0GG71_9CUCU|nr:unnamed protein product [Psylliodes chrysocephala]